MQTEVHEMQSRRRHSQRERGSIIIFAVGVLVLLAVLAAVFLTSSQQQRETGTSTVLQHLTSRSGAGAHRYMDHIVDIISRDVFDPMTAETYHLAGSDPLVLTAPSAYEVWDYPYTRRTLDGLASVGNPRFFNKGGDDPWLAEIDPRPTVGALGLIENAGTYASGPQEMTWMNLSKIHPYGLFVKIGYDPANGTTDTDNPADYFTLQEFTNPELFDPEMPDGSPLTGPVTSNGIFATVPSPLFDREFADADGDGHYDSRWTRWLAGDDVDNDLLADIRSSMGDLPGYTTYIAARIVDLSGMINVNTATSFNRGPGFGPDLAPISPADVDLARLLTLPDYTGALYEGYSGADMFFEGAWAFEKLMLDLHYDVLRNVDGNLYLPGTFLMEESFRLDAYDNYQARTDGLFDTGGSRYLSSRFQVDDELELRSYAARNDPASQSRLEAVFDPTQAAAGPLHSDTDNEIVERDNLTPATMASRVQQYMVDLRHRLTTMSKARRFGPQTGRFPTLHDASTGDVDRPAFPIVSNQAALPGTTELTFNSWNYQLDYARDEKLREYFKIFAQALAPFALLDTPDSHITWDRSANDDYLAYGWDLLVRDGSQDNVLESTEQFAVRTAAHLALNTLSLYDDGDPQYTGINAPPRMARLVYKPVDSMFPPHYTDDGGAPIDDGTMLSLQHAGVFNPGHDPDVAGFIEGEPEVWLFTQKPHPFLVEAVSIVIYEDKDGGWDDGDKSDWNPADPPPRRRRPRNTGSMKAKKMPTRLSILSCAIPSKHRWISTMSPGLNRGMSCASATI